MAQVKKTAVKKGGRRAVCQGADVVKPPGCDGSASAAPCDGTGGYDVYCDASCIVPGYEEVL